jgi:hypothetical protein
MPLAVITALVVIVAFAIVGVAGYLIDASAERHERHE